ncbi:unnamed protein product [Cylindrotheca closterium]|uniref:Uncharacterized protein n=1 Tax=Cylindrotheca closterium TaxID=2856 RepID=A0AAD2FKB1_9STRA|nr:unnamed protein product [Cylindrotheca closterium]
MGGLAPNVCKLPPYHTRKRWSPAPICSPNEQASVPTYHEDFLEMYIQMAPLNGEAFTIDNTKVLVLLRKFTVGNTEAEATLQAIDVKGKGRDAFIALRTHYEGEGLLAHLCYVGEKPTMNWAMFERMLKEAYAAYDKHEGRVVHLVAMKLRNLQTKVTTSFLQLNKTAIDTEIVERPMVMNFTTALQIYRTAVRENFPKETTMPLTGTTLGRSSS